MDVSRGGLKAMSDFDRCNGLSVKQLRFVEHLLDCGSVAEASRKVGRTPRTGRRWLADLRLRAALGQETDGLYAELAIRAARMAGESMDTLRDVRRSDLVSTGARVRACQLLIDTALRLRQETDLQDRVAMLEQRGVDNGKAT